MYMFDPDRKRKIFDNLCAPNYAYDESTVALLAFIRKKKMLVNLYVAIIGVS